MVSCQKGSFRKKASPYRGQRNKHCYLSPATWVESKGYIMEEARELVGAGCIVDLAPSHWGMSWLPSKPVGERC